MNETKFEPRAPDFKADGIAVWEGKDKNGNKLLRVKMVGHETVTVFENKPKPQAQPKA